MEDFLYYSSKDNDHPARWCTVFHLPDESIQPGAQLFPSLPVLQVRHGHTKLYCHDRLQYGVVPRDSDPRIASWLGIPLSAVPCRRACTSSGITTFRSALTILMWVRFDASRPGSVRTFALPLGFLRNSENNINTLDLNLIVVSGLGEVLPRPQTIHVVNQCK